MAFRSFPEALDGPWPAPAEILAQIRTLVKRRKAKRESLTISEIAKLLGVGKPTASLLVQQLRD